MTNWISKALVLIPSLGCAALFSQFSHAAGVCDPFNVFPASSSLPGGASGGPPMSFPGSFGVFTEPAGCPWIATNNGFSWITITSGSNGNANGTVHFSVAKNPNPFTRTGTITVRPVLGFGVGNNVHTIHQGGADEVCIYTINPTNASFLASAGSGSVAVDVPHGCSWTANNNNAGWVTIATGSSGTGPGPVTYNVAANNSFLGRSATLTIAGKPFTVLQAGRFIKIIRIFEFLPKWGPPKTQVRIMGEGFGTDPDALVVGVMSGNGFIPMKVLRVSDDEILAELGAFGQEAEAGPIVVMSGEGHRGFFKPAFPDIRLRERSWVWTNGRFGSSATSSNTFEPQPTNPPPSTRWFFSGPPTNGVLCLYLSGNWFANNKARIVLSAQDHERGIGRDFRADVEFPGNGTLLDCAQRICDAIRCAFNQQAMVNVNCTIEQTGALQPIVKITISLPEGNITWGNFDVCIEPAVPPPAPTITGFTPQSGGEGTEITIFGQNFGSNPRNLAAVILNGGLSIPLKVISANETQVVARLGPVPPRATAGPIQLIPGDGDEALVEFAHGDIRQPVRVGFLYSTDPGGTSGGSFTPVPNTDIPQWPKWFYSAPPANGEVCLSVSSAWPSPALVTIDMSLQDTQSGNTRSLHVDDVEFPPAGIIHLDGPDIVVPLTPLDCAYRICDVIESSLRRGATVVNCSVEQISPTEAKVCLSFADGNVNQGHLNVCVRPALVPPDNKWPIIIDFFPKDAFPGEVITIVGRNFIIDPNQAPDPDDISVAIVNGAMTIPMQAISISDSEILAVLGEVPPNAMPGPLRVSLGRGAFQQLISLPAGMEWGMPASLGNPAQMMRSWQGGGASSYSLQNFNPHYRAPQSNKRCFYSGPPVNGELILVLPDGPGDQWPALAAVTIDFEGISECVPVNLQLLETEFIAGGSVLECAQKICELLGNAFIGGTNPPIPGCTVQQGTNTVVIRVSSIMLAGFFPAPGGCSPDVISGHLNVCVKPARIFRAPFITNFLPLQASEGDIITINGANFGTRPDNLCAVVMNGSNSIPLQVIEASDTQIRAMLGAVPPGAGPGQIMVGLGAGGHGRFAPAFPDIEVRKPVWVWNKTGEAAMSVGTFTPLSNAPPPGTQWFFSGPPTNGALCVFLTGDWPSNAQIRIEARAHNHEQRIGHDLRAIDIRLPDGGTLLGCAQRICDVIRCAFLQQAGITVICEVEEIGRTTVKLTLRLPNASIDWGNFNVCVRPAPDSRPVITDFQPRSGREGDIITIFGNNFIGNPNGSGDPHEYCVVAMDGALSTPFEVLTVTSMQITARLGAVDPNVGPGPLMLGLGHGQRGTFTPIFSDIVPGNNVWTWVKDGADAMSAQPFLPLPSAPTNGVQWFFSGPPTNGVLCVTIGGNWPRPAMVRVEARAHDHARRIGRDLRAVNVQFAGGGGTLECALRICDVIRCAFLQQAGIAVNCSITPSPTGDGSVKITLSLPEGHIDWGNFNVCVAPEPALPTPVITDVSPLRGGEGTLITIMGRNFLGGPDTMPEDICAVVMDGDRSIPIQVLSATDMMIQGVLGPVAPNAQGGPVMIGLGRGQFGFFHPAFPDIIQHEPTWTWSKAGPAAMSTQAFSAVPAVPPTNVVWVFSGPPTNGELCVFLSGNWTAPSRLRVSARAHDHEAGIGHDLSAINIELPNGGSLLDCAHRICDVVRCAFFQQAGVTVNCTVEQLAAAPFVKLTLGLPGGRISWGNFDVCVQSSAPPFAPPLITDVQPRTGSNGTLVTITGRSFGGNPDNLSLAVMNGDSSILLRAIRATDTEIIAEVGMVPPGAQSGPIRIARGVGGHVRLHSNLPQPLSGEVPWSWNGLDPSVLTGLEFGPIFTQFCPPVGLVLPNSPYPLGFSSSTPVAGKLSVTLSGGWPFIAKVYLELQAHNDTLNVARELVIPCHFVSLPSSSSVMANSICNAIMEAFQQQGVVVNCAVTSENNGAKLSVSLPEGPIEWGSLKICVGDGEGNFPPRPEIKVNPSILTNIVFSWPRSATGYEVQVADDLGGDASGIIEWLPVPLSFAWGLPIPLRATETELELQIPVDPTNPNRFFRLSKPMPAAGPAD